MEYKKELENKCVEFQYLPKRNSRKWRSGFISKCYSIVCYKAALEIIKQENWYDGRFIII